MLESSITLIIVLLSLIQPCPAPFVPELVADIIVAVSTVSLDAVLTTEEGVVAALEAAGVTGEVAEPIADGVAELAELPGLTSGDAVNIVQEMGTWASEDPAGATDFAQDVANNDLDDAIVRWSDYTGMVGGPQAPFIYKALTLSYALSATTVPARRRWTRQAGRRGLMPGAPKEDSQNVGTST